MNTKSYIQFITDLKKSIVQSKYQAAKLANREQLLLYFRTGKMLSEKVAKEKWGAKVLEQISGDLQKQLRGIKGFSVRNLKNMRQLFEAYENSVIGQSLTAQLYKIDNEPVIFMQSATAQFEEFFGISFTHHILILNKCSDLSERMFYIQLAATELWSVTVLEHKIDSRLFETKGTLPNNFSNAIPGELKSSAAHVFNDEYLMDYMNLGDEDSERDVEDKIVLNIRNFILRMGKGFSFIGNQFRMELNGDEFFIGLLFFNSRLRCLVAFELKKGKFKPENAGQLNFYLNVLDEKFKLPEENNSIGIIPCKEKNNTVVEFSVKSIEKGMGVATFRTSKEIPQEMKGILPDAKSISAFL